jgi:sporulation protein YlmC with PRC-barrel domain
MTDHLPVDPSMSGQVVDAQLHLLDRQVLDRDKVPVTTVDDVEIEPLEPGSATLVVVALLTGPVFGTRVAGGRPPASRWLRVPWSAVNHVGTVIRLGIGGETLDVTWTERWLRDHVIGRIPGGRHAPD